MCTWDALNANVNLTKVWVTNTENMFASRISTGATDKLPESEKMVQTVIAWSYDVEGHAKKMR